jgi:hypothetical protein
MPIPEDEYRICADAYLFIRTALFGPVRSIDQRLGAYRLHGANNFSYRAELLTNPRKLATHLDNYFKTSRLLREAYKLKGISHDERHFAFSFSALQLLCAAFQHHIDSPFLADLSRFSLTDQVKGYLCSGTDSFMKRIVRSVYLWSVIWSPMPIAGYLMALMEKWQRRN